MPLTLDSGSSGVLSAVDLLESTIASELGVLSDGLFGIQPGGVTATKMATGAAETNLGVVNATSILATGSIVASLVGTNEIITSTANVGVAVIAAASIISLGVNQLTAATAQFSGTATFQYGSSGPYVEIASGGIIVSGGSGPYVEVTSSEILVYGSSTNSVAVTSSQIQIISGSNYMTLSSSELVLSYGGAGTSYYPNVAVFPSSVYVSATANDYIEIVSGTITITSSGSSSTIVGNQVSTGTLVALEVETEILDFTGAPYATASAGSETLPSNPLGFIEIMVQGTYRKIAYYGV